MAQIAAEALALPLGQVSVSELDTDATPHDDGTTASRTTYAMGAAIRRAASDVRRQVLELAAGQLEVSPDDIVLEQGSVRVKGLPGPGLSYAAIVRQARRGNLLGQGTFIGLPQADAAAPPATVLANRQPRAGAPPVSDLGGGEAGASDHWHQGAAAAEVEVDPETGRVRLLRCHSGVVAGRVINPRQCELQLEGSMAFGLGQALLEELVFAGGQLSNPNLADYTLPAFPDMPSEVTLQLMELDRAEDIHGVGESTLPAVIAAISNAVADAIGQPIRELPITPERVLQILQRPEHVLPAPWKSDPWK
jgi:CO/xanthine dehydrogenase Mo-binding subunit